jgi:ribonuclease P protein component
MSEKFSRSQRLISAKEYKETWSKAKRLSGQFITLVNCKNNLGHPRLGLSFSKKHFPHAVDRNRLKRVARETFRLHQDKLGQLDVIAVGYKGAHLLPPEEQYQLFNHLWGRLAKRCSSIPHPEKL